MQRSIPAPDESTVAVVLTVGLVVGTAIVSGPLVGAVDFTHERAEQFAPGSGSATVTVVSTPDRARLDRGSFGSGAYYLRVPDAEVRIRAITGQPLLAIKVRIPAMGYVRSTVHFLDSQAEGRMTVPLESASLAPDEIEQDSYDGELVVLLRTDAGETVLHRGPIDIEVTD